MKTIEIIGTNHFDTYTQRRTACRGIVIQDGKILLSYEVKTDLYMIPGGGMEKLESEEQCCVREIAEETGILVNVNDKFLTVHEFYEGWLYETHFFLCNVVGKTHRELTAREAQVGLVPKWVTLAEARSIFSKHQEYALISEEKRGIYLREHMALSELSVCNLV